MTYYQEQELILSGREDKVRAKYIECEKLTQQLKEARAEIEELYSED